MSNLLAYLQGSTVRHPVVLEPIPDWVMDGGQFPSLDPEWAWFAVGGGRIEGVLIASPCHGLVQLHRLVVAPGSPMSVARALLTTGLKEVRKRGYKHFLVYANPLRAEEARLLALARSVGAVEAPNPHVLALGPLPEAS